MGPGAVDAAVDQTIIDVGAVLAAVRLEITAAPGKAESRAGVLARDWSRCLTTLAEGASLPSLRVEPDPGVRPEVQDYLLTTQVTSLAIEQAAGTRLMLHACGLSDEQGLVLALVGPSGAGKSTAAAVLGRSFGYVTDEVVVIDDDGVIAPFPRPVALDDEALGSKRQIGPDSLGLVRCAPDLRIGRVVLLDRRADHVGAPQLTPVPLADALLELIPQTSALRALDGPLQHLGRLADACGGIFRLTFREIADAEGALRTLLATAEPSERSWSAPRDVVTDEADVEWAMLDGRVRRAPVADCVEADGDLVLLAGSIPVRLSGIGRTVWELAASAPHLRALVHGVEAVHGHHPEAAGLVGTAVTELCAAGVLGFGRPRTLGSLRTERPRIGLAVTGTSCCGATDRTA
jgi:hypothetical protein